MLESHYTEVIAMDANEKMFMCDKATVLNVIYDALEAVSFVIDKSNSFRGTLIVSSVEFPQLGGRIAVSPDTTENKTHVEVFPSENKILFSSCMFGAVFHIGRLHRFTGRTA